LPWRAQRRFAESGEKPGAGNDIQPVKGDRHELDPQRRRWNRAPPALSREDGAIGNREARRSEFAPVGSLAADRGPHRLLAPGRSSGGGWGEKRVSKLSGCGIGLRKEHFDVVLSEKPAVPFFEVISENFMVPGGRPRRVLEQVRRDYPVALHGVSLSLGSADPVDESYLRRLAQLVRWVEPAIVSDHLCWTAVGGHNSHDLLPLPFTEEAARHTAAKIRRVQEALGRRILIENVSSYVAFADATLEEAAFLSAVAEEADCHVLLDVNNVYVNARNHGFNPFAYLDRVPAGRVRQIHLAGHEDQGDVVIDTHDHPVRDEVWELYRRAIARFGAVPALIEWDARIPPFDVVLAEARRADAVAEAKRAAHAA